MKLLKILGLYLKNLVILLGSLVVFFGGLCYGTIWLFSNPNFAETIKTATTFLVGLSILGIILVPFIYAGTITYKEWNK